MRFAFLVTVFLSAALSMNAQWGAEPKLPPEQLAIRTRLEADKSVMQLICGLLMPILPGEMYAAEATKQQAENSKLRLAFYKAAKRGRTVKASYTCGTDEGTIARDYLLAENRKITRIADFSRDAFGGHRFIVMECTDLALGHFVLKPSKEIVYEVLTEAEIKGKVLWLSCQTPEGRSTGGRLTF